MTNLENKIQSLENTVSSLEGKVSLLKEQNNQTFLEIQTLKDLSVVNEKACVLLDIIKKTTNDVIINIFESIITKALCFIHQNNTYQFKLNFKKRGMLSELNFSVTTPELEGSHDLLDCHGGGSNNIISLALRTVLLEVSKTPGFLFLDEPEASLDNPETEQKMFDFVKEFQNTTGRQIFWITHKDAIVNSVPDPIIMGTKPIIKTTLIDAKNEILEKPKQTRKKKNETQV